MRTKLSFGDIIVTAAVVFAAVLLMLAPLIFNGRGDTLCVSVRKGQETVTDRYSLSVDRTFEIENNGIKLKIVIEDGCAYVSESSCGNHICVNSGRISSGGQCIVCAPAGISLSVERKTGGGKDVDAVAG